MGRAVLQTLIWKFWLKKPRKKVYLTPKTFSVNHVRVCPTGQIRLNLRRVAEKEFANYKKMQQKGKNQTL